MKFLNILFVILYKLVFFILSFLIPKNKNLLVFQNIVGEGIREETKYAYLYIRKYLPHYKLIYFANKEDNHNTSSFGIKKYDFNLKNMWYVLRARYIFVETSGIKNITLGALIGRFNLVMLYHGAFLKNETMIKDNLPFLVKFIAKLEFSKYKLITVPHDLSDDVAKGIFHNKNVLNLSHLRNDIFFDKETFSLENIDEKLGLNIYDKIIVYAPTWREKSKQLQPFTPEGLLKLNNLLVKQNSVMLFKLHPFTEDLLLGGTFSNIKHITNQVLDLQELLLFADVLITDYSSCMIDFAITNRPMIFYVYDLEEYKINRGLWLKYDDTMPGPIAYNEEELINFIVDNEHEELYYKKREIFNKRFNKNIKGDSCKILLQKLGID